VGLILPQGPDQLLDGRHELAFILGIRHVCLKVNGRKAEADVVFQKIQQLLPSVDLAELNGAFNPEQVQH